MDVFVRITRSNIVYWERRVPNRLWLGARAGTRRRLNSLRTATTVPIIILVEIKLKFTVSLWFFLYTSNYMVFFFFFNLYRPIDLITPHVVDSGIQHANAFRYNQRIRIPPVCAIAVVIENYLHNIFSSIRCRSSMTLVSRSPPHPPSIVPLRVCQ